MAYNSGVAPPRISNNQIFWVLLNHKLIDFKLMDICCKLKYEGVSSQDNLLVDCLLRNTRVPYETRVCVDPERCVKKGKT